MKKPVCAAIAAALTIALLSCATGGGRGDGLSDFIIGQRLGKGRNGF